MMYKQTKEHRQKLSESHMGMKASEKTKQKMREAQKGNKNSTKHGGKGTRLYRIWGGSKIQMFKF